MGPDAIRGPEGKPSNRGLSTAQTQHHLTPKACRVPRCRILKYLVHVPRLPRRRQQPIAILGQQQPLGDEVTRGLSQSRGPDVACCLARFERRPRIATTLPFGFGLGQRHH